MARAEKRGLRGHFPGITKKAAAAAFSRPRGGASALRELEAGAGFLVAVFLALDDARIAGQEPFLLQRRTQVRLIIGERLGEAMTNSARLPRKAAARDRHRQIVLGEAIGDD